MKVGYLINMYFMWRGAVNEDKMLFEQNKMDKSSIISLKALTNVEVKWAVPVLLYTVKDNRNP